MTTVKLRDLKQGDRFKLNPKGKIWTIKEFVSEDQWRGAEACQGNQRRYIHEDKELIPVPPLPFLTQLFNKIFG